MANNIVEIFLRAKEDAFDKLEDAKIKEAAGENKSEKVRNRLADKVDELQKKYDIAEDNWQKKVNKLGAIQNGGMDVDYGFDSDEE